MKVVHINTFPYKATGHIMLSIHNALLEEGFESYVAWGRGENEQVVNRILLEDKLGITFHGLYTRLFDCTGFASWRATKRFLKKLDEIRPDILHIHNLHGYYINIQMLFDYIKEKKISVIWTLHDCWSFTGHCAVFESCGCEKWKEGCHHCTEKSDYPASVLLDNSEENWKRKKALFCNADVTIVTPSKWLENKVQYSFLGGYPIHVIPNGIDTSIFRNRPSLFRQNFHIEDKCVILGVASEWLVRKGYYDILKLAELLPSEKYQIVMVGLNKRQMKQLPKSILGIERTNNQKELAEIYSAADYFLNLTYEDNYPTTNLEAIACGTFVITYETGGSPESLTQETGMIFAKGDVQSVARYIQENNVNGKLISDNINSNEKMIKKYKTLYNDTVKRRIHLG